MYIGVKTAQADTNNGSLTPTLLLPVPPKFFVLAQLDSESYTVRKLKFRPSIYYTLHVLILILAHW